MVALFGEGRHPNAEQNEAELIATGHRVRAVLAATQLGRPYRRWSSRTTFRTRLATARAATDAAAERASDAPVSDAERAQVRTALVHAMFAEEHGRPPVDATLAPYPRPTRPAQTRPAETQSRPEVHRPVPTAQGRGPAR